MDDLLVVRSSERIRPRHSQRRAQAPLAANIGLVLGAACGVAGASLYRANPLIGFAIGLAVGIAIGGVMKSLIKPRTPRKVVFPKNHYQGFPVSTDEKEDAADS